MKNFFINLVCSIKSKLSNHKDKVYHFFCCYTAMLTFTSIAIIKHGAPIEWSINFGIACAIIVGVAKEFYDLYVKKSKFSVADLVADAVGIVLAAVIFL